MGRKSWRPYGTSTIGACQNAAFCPAGSSTVTWQSYLPVGRVANERLNLSGRALDLGSYPSITASGAVSKLFTPSR